MQKRNEQLFLIPMEKTTASRLQGLLKSRGIDEMELAKRIDKHPSTVYRILKGDNEPTKATVKLIADAMGVNQNWLLTGEGQKESDKTEESNPWKDVAFSQIAGERDRLTKEVERLWAMLSHLTKGKADFRTALNAPGFPKRKSLRAAA